MRSIHAAENGAKAIYAEKALCASVAEARAIHACLERHGVHLNLGTNRRWDNGYEAARQKIWCRRAAAATPSRCEISCTTIHVSAAPASSAPYSPSTSSW